MNREQIIRMAREAGISESHAQGMQGFLERFAALVAATERNKLAAWMIERGYATGHGDSIEKLLEELEWQIAEREREACAKVCDAVQKKNEDDGAWMWEARNCAAAIRARGEK